MELQEDEAAVKQSVSQNSDQEGMCTSQFRLWLSDMVPIWLWHLLAVAASASIPHLCQLFEYWLDPVHLRSCE